jgi:hypothetical protein
MMGLRGLLAMGGVALFILYCVGFTVWSWVS